MKTKITTSLERFVSIAGLSARFLAGRQAGSQCGAIEMLTQIGWHKVHKAFEPL